jgi:dTDP-4-dehydrorhamnose reductase
MKTNVLITGSNGQLGKSISALVEEKKSNTAVFTETTKESLDITNRNQIELFFQSHSFNYCINCAAYTFVDKAEVEKTQAFLINATGVKNLAEACKKYNIILIHISTDFVFDGTKGSPYTEKDTPNPINVYGASKLQGETYIQSILDSYFIIRTSWLYSEYGNNFVKTMLRLGAEKNELQVVSDQIGSPTYAKNLAEMVLEIIDSKNNQYGLYHYSNQGALSWFEFANAIFKLKNIQIKVKPIPTSSYPTLARRPSYSVLSLLKTSRNINLIDKLTISSLRNCLQNI